MRYDFISGGIATDAGTWISANELEGVLESLEIDGSFVGTIKLDATNVTDPNTTPPTSPYNLVTDTGPNIYDISGRYEWYRVSITAYTSGTINVFGSRRGPYGWDR